MGYFADIKGQRSTQGGHYFIPDAHYIIEIQRCKMGKTRKDVPFFVVEGIVLETDSDKMKVGAPGEMMVTLDKDPAMGNIADFMRAGLWLMAKASGVEGLPKTIKDIDPDELEAPTAEWVVEEDNPLAGVVIGVFAYNKDTKAGNPFTRHTWMSPQDARTKIEIANASKKKQPQQQQPAA